MAPSKKKKKPTSNPARGFATVSIPSKPKAADFVAVSEDTKPAGLNSNQLNGSGKTEPDLQNYSREPETLQDDLEEAELQSIVEKYASKCRNDASRQASRLETEKRLLRHQSSFLNLSEWLPQELLSRILEIAKEDESQNRNTMRLLDIARAKRATVEEELICRLWTLQGTLLKLHFSSDKIEEVLKYILSHQSVTSSAGPKESVWGLDEALGWLSLHCDQDDLPSYEGASTTMGLKSAETAIITAGKWEI